MLLQHINGLLISYHILPKTYFTLKVTIMGNISPEITITLCYF